MEPQAAGVAWGEQADGGVGLLVGGGGEDEGDAGAPIGEGAGYAGGIMSSATDGLKSAELIIRAFAPVK